MPGIPDITLIGGGIISLLTAREFSRAGASVTIIEKNRIGREASWAGGGILLPLYPWRQDPAISTLVMHSLSLYPRLTNELFNATGIDPEWTDCGLLITRNPDYEHATSWCQSHHIHYEPAPAAQLSRFNTDLLNPLWLPQIAQARNPRFLKALAKDIKSRQVDIVEDCELIDICYKHGHITAINTSQGKFPINYLVLASGAWSGELYSKIFPDYANSGPDIRPIKGQMLLFDTKPGVLDAMVLDNDQYLIPRLDGKILAGSSVEDMGFNKTPTPEVRQQLESFAVNLFPALKHYPLINHWAGLRPGTQHGIPYIGQHCEFDNFSINAGHFRNGLVMGPASAQLLVDLVLDRPPCVNPKPYAMHASH